MSAAAENEPDLSWYNPRDYVQQRNCKLDDWYVLLSHRDAFPNPYDYPSLEPDKLDPRELWKAYLDVALPSRYFSQKSRIGTAQSFPRLRTPLEDITPSVRYSDDGERIISVPEVDLFGARVLLLDASAPDEILKRSFSDALKTIRATRRPATRPRGKPTDNFQITEDQLASWAHYSVLAVLDLDLYCCKAICRDRLPHERLCEVVAFAHPGVDAKDWGRRARKKAQEAIKAIPFLLSQL
jgi:hypothetical protein